MAYESVFRVPQIRHLRGSASVLAIAALIAAIPHRASAQAEQPALVVATAAAAAQPSAAKAEAPLVLAQATSADAGQSPSVEEVTVTGSHIVGNGYQAVSPLTVLNTEDIKASAPSNLSDYVNEIPALAGSVSPQTSNASISAGTAGVNALNLRALGTNRTLVLLDGRRSVGSTVTGVVDINDFPQQLVQRVEVVTGGASAVYGSDAVSGVVNFILDKKYTGIKGAIEGGETTYGDDPYRKFDLTIGKGFLGDRLHVLVSGEYADRDGIYGVPRAWNDKGNYIITNPAYKAGNGLPQYELTANAGLSNATPGGIITNTALRGTNFGIGGAPGQFAYGSQVLDPWMVGGDWKSVQVNNSQSLDADDRRKSIYGRASYQVNENFEIYGEASWNKHASLGWTGVQSNQGNVTIMSDNAYIPASVKSQLVAQNIKSFSLGTTNADLPIRKTDNQRLVDRFVVGADGQFNMLNRDVTWDVYAQNGVTHTTEVARGITNNNALALAQDAVVNPANGQIVCRSTLTSPGNGCVPLDRMGIGVASPAALNYVLGNPYRKEMFEENVAAANFSFRAFDDWAGAVSIATGVEHREEMVNGFVPPQYQSGWFVGNFLPTKGYYQVTEGYVEAQVPLAPGLDFSGATRITGYSTSGVATTWKAGLTYQPVQDVRLRVTESRDIRAPNLNDLFASGTSRTNILTNPADNTNIQFLEVTTGNTQLKPEVARNFGMGAVFSPHWIPGLDFSVDYYSIEIKGAIGSVTSQIIANRCFDGQSVYCNAITYGTSADGSAVISKVSLQPFNFAQLKAQGLDFEGSYSMDLADVYAPLGGTLSLRAMATDYLENYTNNGIDPPTDTAGQNTGDGPPSWRYHLSATYSNDPWTVSLIGRGVSAGTYSNAYVTCTTGCPLSTVTNTTINNNHIDGAFYVDTTLTYGFEAYGTNVEAYFSVQNIANKDPALVAYGPAGTAYGNPSTNQGMYDILGRVFKVGVRFEAQ
jgi:iron complex outermembrane receptor protein